MNLFTFTIINYKCTNQRETRFTVNNVYVYETVCKLDFLLTDNGI